MAGKKLSRAQIIESLKAAIEDVRLNGRQGRTVPEIAKQFGVKASTLKTRMSREGLSSEGVTVTGNNNGGPFEGATIPVQDAINPDGSLNSLQDSDIWQLSSKLVENRGNEGATTPQIRAANTSGENVPKSALNEADSAILEVKAEVVREYKRLLREARRQIEIKNVRDYKAVADHLLELLGDSKGGGKSAPLIQVTILGDSGNREPKFIRSINDSGNEKQAIEAESVTA